LCLILFQSWGPFGFIFYTFSSSCLLLFLCPHGRAESCFAASMVPVEELDLRQAGNGHSAMGDLVNPVQPHSGQGQPSHSMGPTTACCMCPVMANIPIFTGLQDNELCIVACRGNNVICLLEPVKDPLIFPVQEKSALGFFKVVMAQAVSFVPQR